MLYAGGRRFSINSPPAQPPAQTSPARNGTRLELKGSLEGTDLTIQRELFKQTEYGGVQNNFNALVSVVDKAQQFKVTYSAS